MSLQQSFDEDFARWYREHTERIWTDCFPQPFTTYVQDQRSGVDWQRGTHWLQGLTDTHLAVIEHRWHIAFPADYRLFLQCLHTVDRPMIGAAWADTPTPETNGLEAYATYPFYNWLTDEDRLAYFWEWPLAGFFFDLEHNSHVWRASWGERPATLEAQQQRVRDLIAAAPHLIPVNGHRYLLADPCVANNPVLSVYQSDIIVYGRNLRQYLLREYPELVRGAQLEPQDDRWTEAEWRAWQQIPFWGEFLG